MSDCLQKTVEKLPQWFKNQFDKASTAPKVEQVICHLINTERRGLVWQPVRRMSPLHPKYLKVPLEEVQQQKVIIHLSTLAQFSPAFFSFFFFLAKYQFIQFQNIKSHTMMWTNTTWGWWMDAIGWGSHFCWRQRTKGNDKSTLLDKKKATFKQHSWRWDGTHTGNLRYRSLERSAYKNHAQHLEYTVLHRNPRLCVVLWILCSQTQPQPLKL